MPIESRLRCLTSICIRSNLEAWQMVVQMVVECENQAFNACGSNLSINREELQQSKHHNTTQSSLVEN